MTSVLAKRMPLRSADFRRILRPNTFKNPILYEKEVFLERERERERERTRENEREKSKNKTRARKFLYEKETSL